MDDTDAVFMKRALELARQGAGLVSPNPMVGAVLTKDGRVIGEGFHRYDRLKHAEAYALEMAGDLARGATLYCNLEPCRHHGRTPPCTDSVIEAGIARAVIAAIDPDQRVSGRGIEQMRSAGIAVEVGLREEEALRLNEAYLKYVTSGTPFIHAIINIESMESDSWSLYKPSDSFLHVASEYDCVAIGASAELNQSVIEACLGRERHRKFAIAGTDDDLKNSKRAYAGNGVAVIMLSPAANEIRYADDEESFQIISPDQAAAGWPDLASIFGPIAERTGIRSILALAGSFQVSAASIVSQADKITLIARKTPPDDSGLLNSLHSEFGLDLNDVETCDAMGFNEVTGYPRRGAAKVS